MSVGSDAMPLACWAKKAHLAFARLLEILADGERSCEHVKAGSTTGRGDHRIPNSHRLGTRGLRRRVR